MRFKRIYVEISNICNLKCPFCSKSTRPPRSMNEEEFRHVVREIAPFTGNVYFHVKGEPLLHPLLGRFFDICEENDLRVNLTTNGSLLAKNQELLMRKNALRQVNISLHSFPFQNGANGEAPEFYNELDLDGLDTYMQTALGFAARFARERKKFAVLRLWSLGKGRRLDPAARRMTEIIEAAYPEAAPLEEKMLRAANETGVGPQGFGGDTTCLAVNIETYPTHIAGLPVAVNVGCHVTRHETVVL